MKSKIQEHRRSIKNDVRKTAPDFFQNIFILVLFSLLFMTAIAAKASENGEVRINMVDDEGQPAIGAQVMLMSGDEVVARKEADMKGTAIFKEVAPGKYDIKIVMVFMLTEMKKGIDVASGKTTYLDIQLKKPLTILDTISITYYEPPMVRGIDGGLTIPFDAIEHIPGPKNDIVNLTLIFNPCIVPTADGKDFYSRGARQGSNEYMIDGEKVVGSYFVPGQSIQTMTVFTGGTPACYGDFTGGLVMVTTKSFFNGMQQKKQMYADIQKHLEENAEYQESLKKKKEN
jgi:hypothetical protein